IESRLADLQARWDKERELVSRIRQLRHQLEDAVSAVPSATAAPAAPAATSGAVAQPAVVDVDHLPTPLGRLHAELDAMQGENPLMRVCVDSQIVGEVISGWTGIPVGKMQTDEITTVLSLETLLGQRVVGQNHALEAVSQRIRTSRARLEDPNKPIG